MASEEDLQQIERKRGDSALRLLDNATGDKKEWLLHLLKHGVFLTNDAANELADAIATVITAARAEQREVDAQIAEQFSMLSWVGGSTGSAKNTANNIARTIRAGKE